MIKLENVCRYYGQGEKQVRAIDGISFDVQDNEFVVVRGPSGSGKTTLLLTLGGMLRPTSGEVLISGQNVYELNKAARARFRAQNIGFVFQMFHLLPYLNVLENVLLPQRINGNKSDKKAAESILNRLCLTDRMYHKPSALSAGERQRVAIARAMINKPGFILADEPTGNLDPENSAEVMNYLEQFHCDGGTVIVVTHGDIAEKYASKIIRFEKGRIIR